MKKLTKIQPQPQYNNFRKRMALEMLKKEGTLNVEEVNSLFGFLIEKINELTDEVNRMQGNESGTVKEIDHSPCQDTQEAPKSDNRLYLDEINRMPFGAYYVYWKSGGRSVTTFGYDESGKRWIAPANWINMDKTYVEDKIDDILYFELIAENKHE